MIIILWYLLTIPENRLICQLWTEQIDRAAIMQSCGEWVADHQEEYIAKVLAPTMCIAPLNELAACDPGGERVQIVTAKPESRWLCTISIDHQGEPNKAEITAQCPYDAIHAWMAGHTTWQGPFEQEPEIPPAPTCQLASLPTGPDFYDQPADYTDLATAIDYQVLAYNLRWYGFYQISVVEWQNQWDEAILRAAVKFNIPARVLKAIIAQESQFWPHAVGPGDEWGMIQLSNDGADVALHYSPALFERYCPIAGWGPCRSYRLMSTEGQANIRYVLRADLRLDDLEINRAVKKSFEHIPTYAAILAAYRCHTLALVPGASWDMTLAAYNAGGECIKSGQVCPEGLEYIRKVKR